MVHTQDLGLGDALLECLIQDLPAELYYLILDYVMILEPQTHIIDKHYLLPVQLQVNRYFRESLAPKYYGTSSFYLPKMNTRDRAALWVRWVESICYKYKVFVTRVDMEWGERKFCRFVQTSEGEWCPLAWNGIPRKWLSASIEMICDVCETLDAIALVI